MTHEKRAAMIKKVFFLVLALAVVAGVFLYPKTKPEAAARKAPIPEDMLEIVLHYQPGGTGSDSLSATMDKVATKYAREVILEKVDAKTHPEISKAQGVSKLPHVIFNTSSGKAFEFQGNWTQSQVETKVEEILRGLKRVGKDWRPTVPGMKPAGN